jgi:hypothetical protein
MSIDKAEVEYLLNKLYSNFGIRKEEIPSYAERIANSVKDKQPIQIPKDKSYVVLVYGQPLVYFYKGKMVMLDPYTKKAVISPLEGELYLVGRMGYAKMKDLKVEWREREDEKKKYELATSRIQLLVKPSQDKIEVFDVGKNPAEIITLDEWEKREEEKGSKINKLWIILPLLFLIPLFFLTLGSSTGFFVSQPSYSVTLLDFALVCLIFVFLFVAYVLIKK